jgi:sec-independent protein translocase protein TatB
MFDIGWTELLIIGAVALIVVGPKDLPKMLRTLGRWTGQLRRMAGEFRRQFDEAMRETELAELREAVRDVKSELKKIDPSDDLKKVASDTQASVNEIPKAIDRPVSATDPASASTKQGGDTVIPAAAAFTGPAAVTASKGDTPAAAAHGSAASGQAEAKRASVAERAASAWKKASGDDSAA